MDNAIRFDTRGGHDPYYDVWADDPRYGEPVMVGQVVRWCGEWLYQSASPTAALLNASELDQITTFMRFLEV